MLHKLDKTKKIYMVGAGGVSMSGIAAILTNFNFKISGYDDNRSYNTDKLNKDGIHITIGDVDENDLKSSDLVVFSAAIHDDHKVMQKARQLSIPIMERSDFLGLITSYFKDTICVAGTHGKSTTTSMISLCFLNAMYDPSIQVGAYFKAIDGNYKVGNSEYFIIESCEYHESFLKFHPKVEIILNIDDDHLDYYKNMENIKKAFYNFASLLPKDGLLVFNLDDPNSKDLVNYANCNHLTFGLNNNANYFATDISFDDSGFPSFNVTKKLNDKQSINLGTFSLGVIGKHNVLNAISCIALCDYYKIPIDIIKKSLKQFNGISRRFEYKGNVNGAPIYDDYAHHPTEILATSKAMRQKHYEKSYVIFQPHTYSRTIEHLDDFAKSLLDFDNIILLDVYAAREKNPGNVSSKLIQDRLKEYGKDSLYMPDFDDVEKYIRTHITQKDILITLGAGTVTQLSDILAK